MREDDCQILRQMPVFGGLKDATLSLILERSRDVRVTRGNYLFKTGDQADSAFVLQSGKVAIERQWQNKHVTLSQLGRGDCVGEMALIDLMPRSASALVVEDCQAIEISRSSLIEIYKLDLEQYAIIMMNMGREVSRRLRRADDRLFELEQALESETR